MQDITMRLHRQHDMDLIHLYRIPGFSFQKEMKQALVNFAEGQAYSIQIPEEEPETGYVPSCVRVHFLLDKTKPQEKKALDILNEIKTGYRNSFLKSVFRANLSYIPLDSFAEGDGLRMRKRNILEMTVPTGADTKENMNKPTDGKSTTKKSDKKIADRMENSGVPVKVPVPVPAPSQTSEQNKSIKQDKMALFMQMDQLSH